MSWQDGLAGDGERALWRPPIVEVGGLNFPVRQPRFREAGITRRLLRRLLPPLRTGFPAGGHKKADRGTNEQIFGAD